MMRVRASPKDETKPTVTPAAAVGRGEQFHLRRHAGDQRDEEFFPRVPEVKISVTDPVHKQFGMVPVLGQKIEEIQAIEHARPD